MPVADGSYKPLSPTLWNTISFKAVICHFSIVYWNASHTMVSRRTVSSQKVENQMDTKISGQNKVRGMASDLHKYYPLVMHVEQEMKSLICKVNTWHCQRGLTEPPKPRECCSAAHRSPFHNSPLFVGPQGESQLGFYLCITFFNLFFCIHSYCQYIMIEDLPEDHRELSRRQEGGTQEPSVKSYGLESRCSHFPALGTWASPFTFLNLSFPITKLRGNESRLGNASYIAECFTDARPKDSTILGTVTDAGSLGCHWFSEGVSIAKGHRSQQKGFMEKMTPLRHLDSSDTNGLYDVGTVTLEIPGLPSSPGCYILEPSQSPASSLTTPHKLFLHFGRCYYCLSKKEPLLLC